MNQSCASVWYVSVPFALDFAPVGKIGIGCSPVDLIFVSHVYPSSGEGAPLDYVVPLWKVMFAKDAVVRS